MKLQQIVFLSTINGFVCILILISFCKLECTGFCDQLFHSFLSSCSFGEFPGNNKTTKLLELEDFFKETQHITEPFDYQELPKDDRKFGIVTMATNKDYFPALQTLGFSLGLWIQPDTELLVLVKENSGFGFLELAGLQAVGWKIKFVPWLAPPRPPAAQYVDQFTKMWLWNLTEYDRIMYMDGDMVSLRSQDLLLRSLSVPFAASRDYGLKTGKGGIYWKTFNAGFLLIEPNAQRFREFRQMMKENKVKYNYNQAEQGWLNAVFNQSWWEVAHVHNLNSAVYWSDRPLWTSLRPFIAAFHTTNNKAFLLKFLDWERKEDGNELYMRWMEKMHLEKGHPFSLVTLAPCSAKEQFLSLDIAPIVVFLLCEQTIEEKNEAKKVLFLSLKACSAENCILELLSRVSIANPWLGWFTFFIQFNALIRDYAILAPKIHSLTQPVNQRFKLDLLAAFPEDPLVFGGSRWSIELLQNQGNKKCKTATLFRRILGKEVWREIHSLDLSSISCA